MSWNRNREMRVYRRTVFAIPIFLIVYTSIVFWRELEPGRGEVFPIASWSLFTLVPNLVRDYAVQIQEIDGHVLEVPVYFEDSKEHFALWHGHAARVAIDRMGRALEGGDLGQVEAIRGTFESLFMSEAREVRYELVERHYDPIERFQTGRFVSSRLLLSMHKVSR